MSQNDGDKNPDSKQLDDEALEKLAVEELMREAVQGAARAEVVGPSGWVRKSSQLKTNKRFLVNTIRHAVASNKYSNSKTKTRRSSKRSPKRERKPEAVIKKDRSKQKH